VKLGYFVPGIARL